MKKPYLDLEQREAIRNDSYYGAKSTLSLAIQKVRRDIFKSSFLGWFFMKYFDYLFKTEVKLKKK